MPAAAAGTTAAAAAVWSDGMPTRGSQRERLLLPVRAGSQRLRLSLGALGAARTPLPAPAAAAVAGAPNPKHPAPSLLAAAGTMTVHGTSAELQLPACATAIAMRSGSAVHTVSRHAGHILTAGTVQACRVH